MAQPRLLLDPEKLTAPPVGAGQTDTAVDLPTGQAGGIDELALGERLDPAADLRRRAGLGALPARAARPTDELEVSEVHLQAYREWGEELYTRESAPVYLEQMRQFRQQYPDHPSRAWAAMNRQMLATGGAVLKPDQMSPELQTYMAWKRGEAEASVAAMPSKLQQMQTYGFELPTAEKPKGWGNAFRRTAMFFLEAMKFQLQLVSATGQRTTDQQTPLVGTLDEELRIWRLHDSAAYLQFLEDNGVDTAVIRQAVDQQGELGAAQLFKGAEDAPSIFTVRGLKREGPAELVDLGLAIVQIGGLNKAMRTVVKKKLAQRALVSAGLGAVGYARAKAQQPGISEADAWKAGGQGALGYFAIATLFDGIMWAVERGGVKQVAKEFRLDLNNPTDKGIAQAIYRLHAKGQFVDAEVVEEMARGRGAAGWDVFHLPPGSSRAMLLGRYRRIFRQRGYDRITRIVNGGESVAKHYGSGHEAWVRYKLDLVGWKRLEIAKRILLDPASKEAMADMFRFARVNELYAAGVTRAEELLKREAAAAAGVRPGAAARPGARPGARPAAPAGVRGPAVAYQARPAPARAQAWEMTKQQYAESRSYRPAVRYTDGKKEMFVGERGEVHAQISARVPQPTVRRAMESGWVDEDGKWVSYADSKDPTGLLDAQRIWSSVVRTHRAAVTTAYAQGKAIPPEVLAEYPDLAALAAPKPAYQAKAGRAAPRLPAAPPAGPAKTAAAELDRALASGETDAGTHQLATYLIEKIDPDFDANSAIIVSGAVKKATPDIVKAEGLPTHDEAGRPIAYGIAGATVSDLETSALRTAVRLYRGHDADTVVEEWYHRAWARLDADQQAAYQTYHAASGDARSVNEHFAQEGRDFFFSERQHEQAGPIRQLFAHARESLRALIQRVRQLRGAEIPRKIREMYRRVGQRRWKPTRAPRRPVAAGEPPPPLPTTTTVSPEQALRRYEVERGYIRAGVKYRRTKANLGKIAAAKADTHYQQLKKAAQAARREDTVAVREELTADFERQAMRALADGTMTTELAAYVPMGEWGGDVREVIQEVADAILEGTKSEATRRALEKIVAGKGQDTGAAVQQQKERILTILRRGQEDYSRPGGMIPPAYDWAPAVMDKLTAGEGAGPGAAQVRRQPGVGRQPWQMGEDDWEATLPAVTNEQRAQVARQMGVPVAGVADPLVRAELDLYPGGRDHYAHVTEAMARGENVPAEAKETYSEKDLAEYADLIRDDRTAEIEAAHRGYLDDASMAGLRALASAHGVSVKGVRSRAAIMDLLVERGVAQSPEMPVLVQPHIAQKFAGERWADAVLAGAPAEAPAAAKEPWQMTAREFAATPEGKQIQRPGKKSYRQPSPYPTPWKSGTVKPVELVGRIKNGASVVANHYIEVRQALADGKTIPPQVLAHYPDLAPPAAKQPWQMTKAEWQQQAHKITFSGRESYYHPPDGKRILWAGTRSKAKIIPLTHEYLIRRAIREGEAVPADVLAEYPDLAPAPAKEPWQMTTTEFDTYYRSTLGKKTLAGRKRQPAWDSATGIAIHRQSVEDAIAEGEPVPAEVLAEYPDLAPAAKVTTDLFGRPTFAKLTGAQRELPMEAGAGAAVPAPQEGAAGPELVKAVARLVARRHGPRTLAAAYLALKAQLKGKTDALFAQPDTWQAEMQDAWERATKGERLFEPEVPPTARGALTLFRAGDLEPKVSTPPDLRGVYFSETREMAESFAEMGGEPVREFTVRLANPASEATEWAVARELGVTPAEDGVFLYDVAEANAVTNELQKRGYDGVIRSRGEVIVFDPASTEAAPAAAEPRRDLLGRPIGPGKQRRLWSHQLRRLPPGGGPPPPPAEQMADALIKAYRDPSIRADLRKAVRLGQVGMVETYKQARDLIQALPKELRAEAMAALGRIRGTVAGVGTFVDALAKIEARGLPKPTQAQIAQIRRYGELMLKQGQVDAGEAMHRMAAMARELPAALQARVLPVIGRVRPNATGIRAVLRRVIDLLATPEIPKQSAEQLRTMKMWGQTMLRRGQFDMQQVMADMTRIAEALPREVRGNVMPALARIKGTQSAAVRDFFRRVNDELERHVARVATRRALKRFRGLQDVLKKANLSAEDRERLDGLLGGLTDRVPAQRTLERLDATLKAAGIHTLAIPTGEGELEVSLIPDEIVQIAREGLAAAGKQPIYKLAPEEIELLNDAIANIITIHETKMLLRDRRGRADNTELGRELAGQVRKGRDRIDADFVARTPAEKPEAGALWGLFRELRQKHYRLKTAAQLLTNTSSEAVYWLSDAFVHEGLNVELEIMTGQQDVLQKSFRTLGLKKMADVTRFLRTQSEAFANAEATTFRKIGLKISQRGAKVKPSDFTRHVAIDLPTARVMVGDTMEVLHEGPRFPKITLTAAELGDVMNQLKAPSNRSDIIRGAPLHFKAMGDASPAILFGPDDLMALLNAARKLPQTAKQADTIYQLFNDPKMKSLANETSTRVRGFDILSVPTGEYYPKGRWRGFMSKAGPDTLQRVSTNMLEAQGRLKARVPRSRQPIEIMDMYERWLGHVSGIGRYAAYMEPLRNARMLLTQPDFKNAIAKYYGRSWLSRLHESLKIIENPMPGRGDLGSRALTVLIGNMYKAFLGYRPHIAGYQMLSYGFLLREMDAQHVRAGLHPTHRDPMPVIEKWSVQMKARNTGSRMAIVGPSVRGPALVSAITPRARDRAMGWIANRDRAAIRWTWHAVRSEIMAKRPDLAVNSDEFYRAVAARFDPLVADTQPFFHLVGRSFLAQEAAGGGTVARLGTLFGSVRESMMNQLIESALRYRDVPPGPAKARARARLVRDWTIIFSNSVGVAGIARLWRRMVKFGILGGVGVGVGFNWKEELELLAKSTVRRIGGLPFIFGDVFNAAETMEGVGRVWKDQGKGWRRKYGDPFSDSWTRVGDGMEQSARNARNLVARGEVDPAKAYEGMKELSQGLGPFLGLPIAGLAEMLEAMARTVNPDWQKRPKGRKGGRPIRRGRGRGRSRARRGR